MRGDGLCCETPQERGARMMRQAGYAGGGSVTAPVKTAIKRAVREHETQEHGGKHSTIKLAGGGMVPGEPQRSRPDRKGRNVTVNVIVAKGDDQAGKQMAAQQGMRMGAQLGARAAAARMAGPPGAPPGMPPGMPPGGPAGGPPGMAPPGMPPGVMGRPPLPMQRARGGDIKVREHTRRRAGGGV